MKNNPVFQVLVVSANAHCPAGYRLDQLTVGQLGLFNAETNLAIDVVGSLPAKYYFAVGLPNSAGTLGDIRKSAGEYITKALVNSAYSQNPAAAAAQTILLDMQGFVPAASKDYVIRLTFMSANTMGMQGFNHPVKSFVISTGVAAPSLAAFQHLVIDAINADDEGIIVATEDGTDQTTLTIGADDKITTIGGLNPKYHYLRNLKVTISLGGDWTPNDLTAVTSTGPTYEEGSGYDIKQLEYIAGGWIGNPGVYRESDLTGLIGYSTDTYAVTGTSYWTLKLNYEFKSNSGGNLEYSNQLETVIAIPSDSDHAGLMGELAYLFTTDNPVAQGLVNVVTTTL